MHSKFTWPEIQCGDHRIPEMLSLMNWYSSQKIVPQIKRKQNVKAEEMRCAARIQIRQFPDPCFGLSHMVFPSLKPYRLCRWIKPNCGGVYLAQWTRNAPFGQGLCRLSVWSNMAGWYLSIICLLQTWIPLALTAYIQLCGSRGCISWSNWLAFIP